MLKRYLLFSLSLFFVLTIGMVGASHTFSSLAQQSQLGLEGQPQTQGESNLPSSGRNVNARRGQVFNTGQPNYVVVSNNPTAPGENNIQVFGADNSLIASASPTGPKNQLQLVDVADMDGDGTDEIILINAADCEDACPDVAGVGPAIYIYSRDGSSNLRIAYIKTFGSTTSGVGRNNVKVYQAKLNSGETNVRFNVVVVPETFQKTPNSGPTNPGIVYFISSFGGVAITDVQKNLPENAPVDSGKREGISMPQIAVGDVLPEAGNEVIIVSKARILVFQNDGAPVFYRQFVDRGGTWSEKGGTYDANLDPAGAGGRRYGHIQIVPSLDGDASADLLVVADSLAVHHCTPMGDGDFPFTILEAHSLSKVPRTLSGSPSFMAPFAGPFRVYGAWKGDTTQDPPGSVCKNLPPQFKTLSLGIPVNGIIDVDGDAQQIPEIVISRGKTIDNENNPDFSTKPFTSFVSVFKIQGGTFIDIAPQLTNSIRGTCLDVVNLGASNTRPDLIVWDYASAKINFWRWNGSTFASNPQETIPNVAVQPVLHDADNFALSGDYETHGSNTYYWRLVTAKAGERKQVVITGNNTACGECGVLTGYSRNDSGQLVAGLKTPNPGKLTLIADSSLGRLADANSTFLVNTFFKEGSIVECNGSGNLQLYHQVDTGLTPNLPNPGSCSFSLSVASQNFPTTGGPGTVQVTTPSGCYWKATSNVPWITFPASNNQSGPACNSETGRGGIVYQVGSNTGANRSGTVTIEGGPSLTITQDGTCTYSVSPPSITAGKLAADYAATVTTGSQCSWNATTTTPWITLLPPNDQGTGTGEVRFHVETNPSSRSRSGSISITGGKTLSIAQTGLQACEANFSTPGQTIGSAGGLITANVISQSGCSWMASSNVTWISFPAGNNGNGTGTLTYQVAANPSPSSRTGTITLSSMQTLTVTQGGNGGSCSYSFSPTTQTVSASGGNSSVNIVTQSTCNWVVTSNVSWITFPSGNSGNGGGVMTFLVASNSSVSSRAGVLTLTGGQTLNVTQEGNTSSCTYSFSQTAQTIPGSGGDSAVGISTQLNCGWVVTSNVTWITFPFGNTGVGGRSFAYTVAPNTSTSNRVGVLTLTGGQTLTVTQTGGSATCVTAVSPTNPAIPASGGAGFLIQVTSVSGCTWTVNSSVSWIHLVTTSGTGNGTVTYTVDNNTSLFSRSGTITIGGKLVTIDQDGRSL